MTPAQRQASLTSIRELLKGNAAADLFPDTGPYRRELYPKHMEFFEAGKRERVRLLMAANRIGKTLAAGYELQCHLTGRYESWWQGKRFRKPVSAWACGDTGKTVRDIVQSKLLGPPGALGTGLIPRDCILQVRPKAGVPNAVDTVSIKSEFGTSLLTFKSYDQKRESFQGTEQDVIDLDEEPPLDVQNECLLRCMPTGEFEGGIMMLPFTPLRGLTPLILHLRDVGTWEIGITWDDVPHLTEADKAEILANTPAHLRDARSKGIPLLGSGAIFQVPEDMIIVEPFETPKHWVEIGGMDFGMDHPTAATKLVIDRDADCIYVTREYRVKGMSAPVHASALKKWGADLPWAWPSDGLQTEKGSGEQLAVIYRDEGLKLTHDFAQFPETRDETERTSSRVSVEAGIFDMHNRMETNRWKVFRTCPQWLDEYRQYHRDEKGKIVKQMDDLIDSSRYGMMMMRYAIAQTVAAKAIDHNRRHRGGGRVI
jgi:phage terminase large subunit-like protein